MAEFTDTLNTPSDYKRPVGNGANAVDVFGPVADLVKMVTPNKSSGGDGLSTIKAIRDLRADQAKDEAAIMTTALMTGDSSNLETLLGEEGKPYLDEMKRLQELRNAEELDPQQYDVFLNRTLLDIQAKYPDAADELGQWFAENKFDHAIGREWKAREAAQKSRLEAVNAQENEWAKIGQEYGLSLGLSQEVMSKMTYNDWVNKGLEVVNLKNKATLDDEKFRRAKEEQERTAAATAAEQEAGKLRLKTASESVVQNHLSSADPGLKLILDDISNLALTVSELGDDPTKIKQLTDASKFQLQVVDQWELQTLATARAQGVGEEYLKPITEQAARVRKYIENYVTGPASSVAATARQHEFLKTRYGIEGIQAIDGLTALKETLGADIVNKLFDGTLPGFGAADITALRDKMVGYINSKNANVREATAAMLDFQRALNSPDIPVELDPKKVQEAVIAKAVGLASSVQDLNNSLKGSKTAASHFVNGSKGLMKVFGDGLGPTITPESLDKGIKTLFTANWRTAWSKSQLYGVTPDEAKNVGNLSAILAGEALDTINTSYSDKVKFNPKTGKFDAAQENRGYGSVSGGAVVVGPTPEGIKLAAQANALLDHLEFMNSELKFVPEEALKGDGSAESKTTVREIFASETNLAKSLNNWINSGGPSEATITALSQFDKVFNSIKNEDRYGSLFKNNVVGTVSDRMQSATLRGSIAAAGAPQYRNIKGIDDYLVSMGKTEGGGDRGNFSHNEDRSSAAGTYGFLNQYTAMKKNPNAGLGTWDQNLIEVMPEAAKLTPKERWELMADPVVEDTVMKHFTAKNAAYLASKRGAPPSWEEINIAHLLGAEGAVKFLNEFEKNPLKKASDVLPADVVENNPELTKGTLLYLFNRRTGRGDASFEAYIKERHGVDFAQVPSQDYLGDINLDD